jgi:hypothetical protein
VAFHLCVEPFIGTRLPQRVKIGVDAGEPKVRIAVAFESAAFNMAEPKHYFINPCRL